jgi:hypothetical protein
VPGEQRRWGNREHLGPPTPWDQPGKRRQPQPVSWLISDAAALAAQHHELGILGHLAPGQNYQTAEQTTYDQVEDRKDHSGMIPAHNTGQDPARRDRVIEPHRLDVGRRGSVTVHVGSHV